MDPARRRDAFEVAMSRIAGRFSRYEPRLRAGRLVLGLLSDLPRKNCWTIAEWAGGPARTACSICCAGPPGMPTAWITWSATNEADPTTPPNDSTKRPGKRVPTRVPRKTVGERDDAPRRT